MPHGIKGDRCCICSYIWKETHTSSYTRYLKRKFYENTFIKIGNTILTVNENNLSHECRPKEKGKRHISYSYNYCITYMNINCPNSVIHTVDIIVLHRITIIILVAYSDDF